MARELTTVFRPKRQQGRKTWKQFTNLVLWCFIVNFFRSNMLKVVKIRLYPDAQQQQSLAQAFGSCRWLWNYFLN
ncbi:helix-turn-helix domain-containing protein, partial [Dolichospermum sp. LEGE 00246]|uniref:helix-turn-helix domain-containing protein n=1 Tax=Dolichospermum sp. LEGE 00246 TaxID=1828605 RepID=UPI001D158572